MPVVDALVVGAGVVGLAVARRMALAGLETLVVDGESAFGTWTSSRNSEVIHAGIYYPAGSLKASLCVKGKAMLYRYCAERGIAHRRVGKLIFAARPEESGALDAILSSAAQAGVDDLVRLDPADVRTLEPALGCHEALLSPSTGIVDSHGYMTALLTDLEAAGGQFVPHTRVTRISRDADGLFGIHIDGDEEPAVHASRLVNSAGLAAHDVAAMIEGLAPTEIPAVRYARGVYFTYGGRVPFRHLIYPVPVPGGLGTHLTLDLAGMARFGPDVEWIDEIDYTVDPQRRETFAAAARLIWPDLDPGRLNPGYSGIRPKLSGPGEPAADFVIAGPDRHAVPGLVNLFGIESPGLTASLAIADMVADALGLAQAEVAAA
jgi:L-2-hydroxyglutarate oxidase LhgO